MSVMKVTTGLVIAAMLSLTASVVNAAPGATGLSDLKVVAGETPMVEKTYWTTQCRWHHGHRHCRKVWVRPRHHHHHRHW